MTPKEKKQSKLVVFLEGVIVAGLIIGIMRRLGDWIGKIKRMMRRI